MDCREKIPRLRPFPSPTLLRLQLLRIRCTSCEKGDGTRCKRFAERLELEKDDEEVDQEGRRWKTRRSVQLQLKGGGGGGRDKAEGESSAIKIEKELQLEQRRVRRTVVGLWMGDRDRPFGRSSHPARRTNEEKEGSEEEELVGGETSERTSEVKPPCFFYSKLPKSKRVIKPSSRY